MGYNPSLLIVNDTLTGRKALDILEEFPKLTNQCLQLHIGIDTGPVVAGVIGKNKFIYDLWGDGVTSISKFKKLVSSAIPWQSARMIQLFNHQPTWHETRHKNSESYRNTLIYIAF